MVGELELILDADTQLIQQVQDVLRRCLLLLESRFQVATDSFQEAGCPLITLSDYQKLVKLALDKKYISADMAQSLQEWRKNPSKWGTEHAN